MPNLNLIAARREEKKRLERNTRRLFLGLVGTVASVLVLVSALGAQRLTLKAEQVQAEAKLEKLKPILDEISRIEKESAELKPKVETLQTAKADTLRWRAMYQVVSQSVPPSTWLAGMSSAAANGETILTLTGVAPSQTLVGECMTRLGRYPLFDKVELRFTQTAGSPEDPVQRINFEIGARLTPTAPKEGDKAKTEGGGGSSDNKTAQAPDQEGNGNA
jgi:Tfp pilus assembly protein PilN